MEIGETKHSLLLVDADPKSLRVLDVVLKKAGFQVIAAPGGVEALAAMERATPDLIISETHMAEMDGLTLCRHIKERPQWAKIPIILLSSNKALDEKIRALELGVEDYLTKPIYIKEITTRVRMLLARQQRERLESRREGRTKFTGQLSDIGVIDLVQTIEVNRKSGIVHIIGREGRRGAIYFRDGKVVDAEVGRLLGADALYRLFSWAEGSFEVDFKSIRRKDVIELSQQALLMEGMRRLDEWTHLLETFPSLATVFEVDYHLLAQRLGDLPDEVNRILRLFDGRRTTLQAIDDCDFGDLDALSIVVRLRGDGLIYETHPGPAPEPGIAPRTSTSGAQRLGRWLSRADDASRIPLGVPDAGAAAGRFDADLDAEFSDDAFDPSSKGSPPAGTKPASGTKPDSGLSMDSLFADDPTPVVPHAAVGANPDGHEEANFSNFPTAPSKVDARLSAPDTVLHGDAEPTPALDPEPATASEALPDAAPEALPEDSLAEPTAASASFELQENNLSFDAVTDASASSGPEAEFAQPADVAAEEPTDTADELPGLLLFAGESDLPAPLPARPSPRAATLLGLQPLADKFGADLFANDGVSEADLFSDTPSEADAAAASRKIDAGAAVLASASQATESPPFHPAASSSGSAGKPKFANDVDGLSQSEMVDELGLPSGRRPLKIVGALLAVAGLLFAASKANLLPGRAGEGHTADSRQAAQATKTTLAPRAPATSPTRLASAESGLQPGTAPGAQPAAVAPGAESPRRATLVATTEPKSTRAPAGAGSAPLVPAASAGPTSGERDRNFAVAKAGCRKAYEARKYAEIVAACRRALDAKPDAADVMVMLAHAELDRGHSPRALDWATQATAAEPNLAEAYVFIGGAQQEAGRRKEAKAAYTKYLELAPKGQYANDLRAIVSGL